MRKFIAWSLICTPTLGSLLAMGVINGWRYSLMAAACILAVAMPVAGGTILLISSK